MYGCKKRCIKIVKDESYELTSHRDIIELKKSLEELKTKADKSSSVELLRSMGYLTKSMDTMLKLFKDAAEDINTDEDHSSINEKLDKIMDQNKVIADGMVAISDMVKDFDEKQKKLESIPQSGFQPPGPEPSFPPKSEPNFQSPPNIETELNELPSPQQLEQPPRPSLGPVVMPSMPFSDLEKPKKKKGLFGRFKQ